MTPMHLVLAEVLSRRVNIALVVELIVHILVLRHVHRLLRSCRGVVIHLAPPLVGLPHHSTRLTGLCWHRIVGESSLEHLLLSLHEVIVDL